MHSVDSVRKDQGSVGEPVELHGAVALAMKTNRRLSISGKLTVTCGDLVETCGAFNFCSSTFFLLLLHSIPSKPSPSFLLSLPPSQHALHEKSVAVDVAARFHIPNHSLENVPAVDSGLVENLVHRGRIMDETLDFEPPCAWDHRNKA